MKSAILGLAAILISVIACASPTENLSGSVPGTYDMKTINSLTLPVRLATGQTLTGSVLVLGSDNSYHEVLSLLSSDGTASETTLLGNYVTDGRQVSVTFVDQSGSRGFVLDVADKYTLTENDEYGLIVYAREK